MNFHLVEEAISEENVWFGEEGRQSRINEYRGAQKFVLGDIEQFPGEYVEWKEFPRLPYDACVFEFDAHAPGGESGSMVVFIRQFDDGGIVALPFGVVRKEVLSFGVFQICRGRDDSGVWMPHRQLCSAPAAVLKSTSDMASGALSGVGLALRVLNCANVRTEDVVPSDKVNRRRALKSKPPICSYKVLVLRRSTGGGVGDEAAGLVRVHLRRGHIKRRKTGEFWWQPCVVGNKKLGVILKTYRADQFIAEAGHA